jgi:FHS family L-fucose permease-like MFS transporter
MNPPLSIPSGKNMRFAFAMVTSLFFLWGTAYGLLDVLNKHFQENLDITKSRSALLQTAYFGAYFLMALPAGEFMQRFGYKRGIILGLSLFAAGAFLFYPATGAGSYPFFLVALFILACGLACLETAANPYITVLGSFERASFRLNLAQSFNGVGSFIGPLIGGALFFSGDEDKNAVFVQLVYVALGVLVTMVALIFLRTPLPDIRGEEAPVKENSTSNSGVWQFAGFRFAVIAQFFYVAAQVGIAAFFINYCEDLSIGITPERAAYFLSVSMIAFTAGRFLGAALMTRITPATLLMVYGIVNIILVLIVVFHASIISVYLLMAVFFFESIMFPTIFSLGVQSAGKQAHKASSFLVMAIVGGAVVPYFMGWVSDAYSTATAYLIPFICFCVVALFGFQQRKASAT